MLRLFLFVVYHDAHRHDGTGELCRGIRERHEEKHCNPAFGGSGYGLLPSKWYAVSCSGNQGQSISRIISKLQNPTVWIRQISECNTIRWATCWHARRMVPSGTLISLVSNFISDPSSPVVSFASRCLTFIRILASEYVERNKSFFHHSTFLP